MKFFEISSQFSVSINKFSLVCVILCYNLKLDSEFSGSVIVIRFMVFTIACLLISYDFEILFWINELIFDYNCFF